MTIAESEEFGPVPARARLAALARAAGQPLPGATHAATLAELQRAAAVALHEAVEQARRQGVSWRELATAIGMAPTTLHGQYRSGRGVSAVGIAAVGPGPDIALAAVPTDHVQPGADKTLATPPAAGLDRFVGRERELADLRPLLARNRLVTLTGPAGVGKTRLAVEFAGRARDSYRGGVRWVELAPILSGDPVASAVATALGGRETAGHSACDAVVALLGGDPALLILDNAEHVLDGCAALVVRLLESCPRLRLLVTSREALGVRGEARLALAPLTSSPAAGGEARQLEAVQLYADRARSVIPDFEMSEAAAVTIAQLCRRLDGLPLAIELAARQAGVLTAERLLARMDERLTLIAGVARDAPSWHRSLGAAIERSYDLMSELEQAVFRRLAVLPGGFDEDGAAAVAADLGIAPGDLWAILRSLAGKSLVVSDALSGRFRILESLRAFGLERLGVAGELDATHDRLLDWLTGLATPIRETMTLSSDLAERLDAERHNLRYGVLRSASGQDGRHPLLVLALAMVLRVRGRRQDADAVLSRLSMPDTGASVVHVLAQLELSHALRARGQYEEARRIAEQATASARALGDRLLESRALTALIPAHQCLGTFGTALALTEQRLAILRALDEPGHLLRALSNYPWDLLVAGRVDAAEQALEEVLAAIDEPELATHQLGALHTAGSIALVRDNLEQARGYFVMALDLPSDSLTWAYCIEGLAIVAARGGDAERALRLLFAARAQRSALGYEPDPWWAEQCTPAESAAREMLTGRRSAAAIRDGRRLSADEATAYALSDDWPHQRRHRAGVLAPREQQVAELVADGLTNPQIGARLNISARTVASHLQNIRAKLDLPTRAQVTAWVTNRRQEKIAE